VVLLASHAVHPQLPVDIINVSQEASSAISDPGFLTFPVDHADVGTVPEYYFQYQGRRSLGFGVLTPENM